MWSRRTEIGGRPLSRCRVRSVLGLLGQISWQPTLVDWLDVLNCIGVNRSRRSWHASNFRIGCDDVERMCLIVSIHDNHRDLHRYRFEGERLMRSSNVLLPLSYNLLRHLLRYDEYEGLQLSSPESRLPVNDLGVPSWTTMRARPLPDSRGRFTLRVFITGEEAGLPGESLLSADGTGESADHPILFVPLHRQEALYETGPMAPEPYDPRIVLRHILWLI